MNLPSVKTLTELTERYTGSMNDDRSDLGPVKRAKLIRKILEEQEDKPYDKLSRISDILGLHDVEYIRGIKSPSIKYINTGDTYDVTLLYIYGRGYRVTSWGDIVERGSYE